MYCFRKFGAVTNFSGKTVCVLIFSSQKAYNILKRKILLAAFIVGATGRINTYYID